MIENFWFECLQFINCYTKVNHCEKRRYQKQKKNPFRYHDWLDNRKMRLFVFP